MKRIKADDGELTPLQLEDIALLEKARAVAKWLGCGYFVVGVGPGALFSSTEHPRHPLDMAKALVERLYNATK